MLLNKALWNDDMGMVIKSLFLCFVCYEKK